MPRHVLTIDLETYSSVDIKSAGAWAYADSPDFQILLFAYALDDHPTDVIDIASGESVPQWLVHALHSEDYEKHAFNAAFEFVALSKVYGEMQPEQWRCSMVHTLYCGYPGSLDAAGQALCLTADKAKMSVGKQLIRYFCCPVKPTKANGGRTRNLPHHDPDKWALFKEYNRRDVDAEKEIDRILSSYPVPEMVQHEWETDLRINRNGVAIDADLVSGALAIGEEVVSGLTAEAKDITGLENPNSVSQITEWLEKRGVVLDNLQKATVADQLSLGMQDQQAKRVLELRQELGKTSNKKYEALETCMCHDQRVRGLLQFYGANRTGRWAGRLVQVQNLPRTYIQQLDLARALIKQEKTSALQVCFGSVQDTLSQMIRTAFIASEGNVLIDADFSAIEARVIAWLAGEEWRIKAFEKGDDIYCESASRIYGVPVVKHGENGHLRQKGKIAELACGYGGGIGAMKNMGGSNLDMTDEELGQIVSDWRTASPKIVQLWRDLENAAMQVVQAGGEQAKHGMIFAREFDMRTGHSVLSCKLHSGRKLFYVEPEIGTNRFGNQSITYMGLNQETKKWCRMETYGGKITENCVQAIARDCLSAAIENVTKAGLQVIFHIHDEIVIDTPRFGTDEEMLERVTHLMTLPIPWAKGLPLNAEGWVGKYFKKD